MSAKSRIVSVIESLENRTLLSAVAGSAYTGFGTSGVLAGYQVLAAQKDGSLIAANSANKLFLLHPDGTLEGSYGGARPATTPNQNVQSDGKYLIVKNGVLTRYLTSGAVDKTFGVNGSVSNFFVSQANHLSPVYHVQKVAVDGTQIFVTGYYTFHATNGDAGTEVFVERITPAGKVDTTFGNHGIANPLPEDTMPNYGGSFFTEIGPDHNIYVADDLDLDPIVNRYSESGKFEGTLFADGSTEGETVAGIAFQGDGKILVLTKTRSTYSTLVRYNPDLTVDMTFGSKGEVLVAPPTSQNNPVVDDTPTTVFVRPDGIIFVSGTFMLDNNQQSIDSFSYNPGLRANPSAISGHIFNDVNNNGKLDSADPPLRYWAAYIDLNHDGVYETGEPVAYSDYNGYFKIDGLAAGTYTLREVNQSGYAQTEPSASAGGVYKITLAANQLVGLRDFGNRVSAWTLGTSNRYVQVSSETGDDTAKPTIYPTVTQTASGTAAFNGNVSESHTAKYLEDPEGGFYDTITVSGSATQKSTVNSAELTDSGTVAAFEDDNYATGPSFGKGESFFQQTFTVAAAANFTLVASATPVSGLIGYSAAVKLTGPGGAVVLSQSGDPSNAPFLAVNHSGVLAAGTYTLSYDVTSLDDDNNGPSVNYSLDFKV